MPKEERRALVLDRATALFAREGLGGATIDAIASDTGVAKPGIYELFPSKDALFEATFERELQRFGDHVTAAYVESAQLDLPARTRARVDAVFRYAETNTDGLRLLLLASHHPTPAMVESFDMTRARLTDRLAAVIGDELTAAGLPAGRAAEALALLAVETTTAAALRSFSDPDWDPATVADLVAGFFVGGFAGLDPDLLARLAGDAGST